MMINSEVLRKKLNEKSLIDWINNDNSSEIYKQGVRSGIIKALAIISEVEYFEKYGHFRQPIELEIDEKTTEYLKIAMGAIGKKIEELDVESQLKKDKEVERLRKSLTKSTNLLIASLSGRLHLENQNKQLREALKMCSPFKAGYCKFCLNDILTEKHADDCEYIRLIGGVAND
jgi:hypothetical protein